MFRSVSSVMFHVLAPICSAPSVTDANAAVFEETLSVSNERQVRRQ